MDVETIPVTLGNSQFGKPYLVKLEYSKGLRYSLHQEELNLNPGEGKLDVTSVSLILSQVH